MPFDTVRPDNYRALHRDVALDVPVTKLRSANVLTAVEADPVRRAVEIPRRRGIKHVPVVAGDGRIVGMISFRDVLWHSVLARYAGRPELVVGPR